MIRTVTAVRRRCCCALLVILALLLPFTVSVTAEETADTNADILEREYQIDALLSERDRILAEEPVNIMQLNTVELELMDLGVTFLTDAQAAVQFSDAYASVQGTGANEMDENGIAPRIDAPENRSNRWTLRTIDGYEYMGEYYVIVDVDSWSENGDGTLTPIPNQSEGNRAFSVTPINAMTSFGLDQACYLYANNLVAVEPYYDFVERIVISGLESKRVVSIYPACPRFAGGLAWD